MLLNRRNFISAGAAFAAGSLVPLAASGFELENTKWSPASDPILDKLTAAAVTSMAAPGIALAVWQQGKERYSTYQGLANAETEAPVSHASIFRIGSLTKQFTAALVLKLVTQGKLSLHDNAQVYLPFLAKHDAFTIAELLHHTAGIRDSDLVPVGPLTQVELAEQLAGTSNLFDFQPGTAWAYSNSGYILAGAVIEKVTGMPLATAAETLLFEPLGLTCTAFDTVSEVVPGRASGYSISGDSTAPYLNADYTDVALAGGAGAMRSTASDLCRWHQRLFRGDYLSLENVKVMLTPGRLRNGSLSSTNRHDPQAQAMGDVQYGFGVFLDNQTINKQPIVSHHGGINGFAAYLASHPSTGLTYACVCNADTNPQLPFREIRKHVFANVLR